MKNHSLDCKRGIGVGLLMRMRMSSKIQHDFKCVWHFCGFRRLQYGLFGALIIIIFAAPPNNAVAQYPGVGSEAPSGVVTAGTDVVSSEAAYADTHVSDEGNPGRVGNTSNDFSDVSNQSNYDGGSFGNQSSGTGISTLNLKKKHYRKSLFIKKLRLEFAAIQLVERNTGLPFSRDDVPRYLDELRSDLKMMVIGAENGKITEGALKSISRDAYFIEKHLNDHIDQLLEQAGQPVRRKPFHAVVPFMPKDRIISGAEIDALSLKFELAEYGEKALHALGLKRY